MSRTETVIITNMCMVYEGSRVLVQDRVGQHFSGITFPGGHVEHGESFTDAVIREIREETGLTISNPQLCGIKDWMNDEGVRYVVLLYKTDHFTGELRSSEEGEVFWTERSDLLKMKLAKDMPDVFRVFFEDELSEFYYYKENGEWKHQLK